MGEVIRDHVWVRGVLLTKGSSRESIDPGVAPHVAEHMWVDEGAKPNVDAAGNAISGLKDNVWVDGVHYAKGSTAIPADVVSKIGAHMWVDGPPLDSQVAGDSNEDPAEPADPTVPDAKGNDALEPPRYGKGSSEEAWRDYAEALGVDVSGAASRGDVIAAVDGSRESS